MSLNSSVSSLPFVGHTFARRLEKLRIFTIEDLLLHIPNRYQDFRTISTIDKVQAGETVTVKARLNSIKNIYTSKAKKIQIAEISDNTGVIQSIWFNQPYLVRTFKKGALYSFSGKVELFSNRKSFIVPDYEDIKDNKELIHTGRLVPIYPETSRISSKWLRSKINYAYCHFRNEIEEILPKHVRTKLSLMGLRNAIESVHFPKEISEAKKGKDRLAFDEILLIQLKSLFRKKDWKEIKTTHKLNINQKEINSFINTLPFDLTISQKRSKDEILSDLSKNTPMNRLLEGDVGSGKTVVAAIAAFTSFLNGYQTVIMAPTQILAQQHFNTLKLLFDKYKLRISLITSAGIKSDLGKTDIFIGTHALIHKKVDFDKVSLVVIDEQHRFGVEQRAHLISKTRYSKISPHILTMTATPIPRTVALTVYGDLDLSTLDELPKGRKPITTWLVPPAKRESAYAWVREQIIKNNVQAYIICPLIEESQIETMKQVKAATQEYDDLKKYFPDLKLGLIHGKQTSKVKNEVLDEFKNGTIDILVATPVVEVGIDVANATVMIIEATERFGLAQLHQLRGRVGRSDKKSYCLLFTESKSKNVYARLSALQKSTSGFELAELDLKLRGPGEIFGTLQHGFPELKIASWQDENLIKKAKNISNEVIEKPDKYAILIEKIKSQNILPN